MEVKIADFGHSVRPKSEKILGGKAGVPGFIAPEVFKEGLYSHKLDVFSAGAIMFSLLVGKCLFRGSSEMSVLTSNYEMKTENLSQIHE